MKKTIITEKQQATLDLIKDFIIKHGQAPTVTDLAKSLKLKSLRSVTQRLESLEKKGLIKRDRFKHRSITVLDGPAAPMGFVQIPVIASAGCDALQVYSQERYDEFLSVDKNFLGNKHDVVAIRAIGNSMVDAGIHNGDYVLVEITDNVSSGDKVVALLEDMAVIKRLKITPEAIVLEPEAKGLGYSPIVIKQENSRIFGKVLSVIPMNKRPLDDYEVIPEPDFRKSN